MARKILMSICVLGLLLAGVGCASSGANLTGTWEMLNDQGQPNGATKLISEDHFAFGRMRGETGAWCGGGTWKLVDGVYFETVEYHSMPALVGRTLKFEMTLEEGLWRHRGRFQVGSMDLNINETWRRVKGE